MAHKKRIISPRLFHLRGSDNRGLDFEDAIKELSKCGIPLIDSVTGRCVSITVADGVLLVDGDATTHESYCTYTYTIANPASPASDTLSFTGQPANGETAVINGKTYTFQDTLTDSDGNVLIGATTADSIDNLFAAVTLGAGAGTTYAASTTAPTNVTADSETDTTIVITTDGFLYGASADAIAVSETIANATWGDADADQTLVLDAATVNLSVSGTALPSNPYEILSAGVSNKSVDLLAAEINTLLQGEGVSPVGVSASVSGTDYVVKVVIDKNDESALAAEDIERDSVAVTPTNNC